MLLLSFTQYMVRLLLPQSMYSSIVVDFYPKKGKFLRLGYGHIATITTSRESIYLVWRMFEESFDVCVMMSFWCRCFCFLIDVALWIIYSKTLADQTLLYERSGPVSWISRKKNCYIIHRCILHETQAKNKKGHYYISVCVHFSRTDFSLRCYIYLDHFILFL